MRGVRSVLCVGVVSSVLVSGVASAAKHPARPRPRAVPKVCDLILDTTPDGVPQYTLGAPVNPAKQDDSLDIVSADIASNATTLTAVIRMKNLSASSNTAVTGRAFDVNFRLPGAANQVFLGYQEDASGAYADYGDIENLPSSGTAVFFSYVGKGSATGSVNLADNTIHISVPISALAAFGPATPGTKITALDAQAQASYGQPAALGNPYAPSPVGELVPVGQQFMADDDSTAKSYVAGTPSCVTPGH